MRALWYPKATRHPSTISHPKREATWGVTIHWTAGRKAGDIATLDGPNVDVHLYAAKDGSVTQFLPLDRQAWHGMHTANHNTIGIETEGSGEAWTLAQFAAMVDLCAWLHTEWGIPVVKVDPVRSYPDGTNPPPQDWNGFFGHRDLAHIDGNDHTDTVPAGTGWGPFLAAVQSKVSPRLMKGPLTARDGSVAVIATGYLTDPLFVQKVTKALKAAGKQPPWTATVSGKPLVTGRFWPLGKFNRAVAYAARTGSTVYINNTVTITKE